MAGALIVPLRLIGFVCRVRGPDRGRFSVLRSDEQRLSHQTGGDQP